MRSKRLEVLGSEVNVEELEREKQYVSNNCQSNLDNCWLKCVVILIVPFIHKHTRLHTRRTGRRIVRACGKTPDNKEHYSHACSPPSEVHLTSALKACSTEADQDWQRCPSAETCARCDSSKRSVASWAAPSST